jgi:hypothetical protein
MWLSLRGTIVLLLVVAVAAGGAQTAAAAQTRAVPATEAHTTTVVQATAQERSAPLTALLVGAGAVVGVIVGLIPALVIAMLLGYVPPPRLRRGLAGVLVEPPRAPPQALREPVPELPPAPVAAAAAAPRGDEPPPIAILAHARHQSVYDSAYTEQLERVEALRATIGGRLRKRPEPPGE